jgi:two-component system, NtrC family, response regulator HydG
VEVSCANLEPLLFDSELFGHERGAFTGAVASKPGLVEAADGGTLFLDEIGDMPLPAQAKLLSFLDHRTFRRVGSTKSATANVRVIAATNVDLKAAVAEKRFREDLYYRLEVLPIVLPPLRERREDLEALIAALSAAPIAPAAMALLLRHRWPGNLRELRNALERAALRSRGGQIEVEHLPAELDAAAPRSEGTLVALELQALLRALKEHGGNRSRAAKALWISRSTLLRRLAGLKDASL